MHAGIVNGGGFLLIRLSPIFENTTTPLFIALVFGLITTCFGIFCMWGQTSVKKKLAWSTVGQMGFMIFQCGLGAFSLALIHIIGHGFYKAHAFLTS
ncbi:UNVERIFIED_CONTAM: hypothetical protein GTU68_007816, partial [Idotea baltica]|nr:hypothetical protein [Idotea baltica]